jgi:hypothetical protein
MKLKLLILKMLPVDLPDDYDLYPSSSDLSYGADLEREIYRQLHQELVNKLKKQLQELDITANPNDEF